MHNKLKNMKHLSKLLLLVIGLTISCSERKSDKTEINNMEFGELFCFYLTENDSATLKTIENVLDDSLRYYSYSAIYSQEDVDSNKNEILLDFKTLPSDYDDEGSIKRRNVFLIEIDRYDSIIYNEVKMKNSDSLLSGLKRFIFPSNNPDLPELYEEYIEGFGNVLYTKHGIIIYALLLPDSTYLRTSWAVIKENTNLIIDLYKNLRMDKSLKIWGEEYSNLSLKRKVILSKILPIRIWIYPNCKIQKPPVPPQPQEKNNEEFISDN